MIYTPADAALILGAIYSITLSNSGYTNLVGFPDRLIPALTSAEYVVIRSADLHGNSVLKGFTPAAQAALKIDGGVSTYKPLAPRADAPDYEGAILARNDHHLFA